MESKNCLKCNKSFMKKYPMSKSKWDNRVYCGRGCHLHPKETRIKMSIAKIGRVMRPKGFKVSDEVKLKMGKAQLKRFSNVVNHPRWILDRSKIVPKQERNDSAYKDWRRQVWLRDNFKCKIANQDCLGRIEAHHILGWSSHPELRYIINNGITLCHAHHPKKRAEEKRLSPYFQDLVSVSK